jgi:Xaa-Pro aminopeptidase
VLTKEGCKSRISRLWKWLPEDVEWVLIADPRHVNYFSGFWLNPLSQSLLERSFLLLERTGKTTLFCENGAYKSKVSEPFIDELVKETWYDQIHAVENRDLVLFRALRKADKNTVKKKGLIENEWFPERAYRYLPAIGKGAGETTESLQLGSLIRKLRRNKEQDEIELIKRCVQAGDAGNLIAHEMVQPGITEFDVYKVVQNAVLEELGCPGLVYGDFRAASPEKPKKSGSPTEYVLRKGDTFILDFAVVLNGYRSDTTNTIPISPLSDELKDLFDLCLTALQKGEGRLKPGISAKEVYFTIAKILNTPGATPRFPHHAGHGIGLGHPEPPILVSESTDILELHDVIAVEPGAYVEGIGGVRIEHNYLLTEKGFERLTKHGFSG